MSQHDEVFELRLQSKLSILFLFAFVGGPMMYGAYLSLQVEELFYAALMVLLFLIWAVVILIAIGFKIRLTDSSLYREGLFSPSIIKFDEVDAIHFGSTWSNFYVEADEKKIYFGKDFENYEQILQRIVSKVKSAKDLDAVRFMGDAENIEAYTGSR